MFKVRDSRYLVYVENDYSLLVDNRELLLKIFKILDDNGILKFSLTHFYCLDANKLIVLNRWGETGQSE